jgi:hypothetical protein
MKTLKQLNTYSTTTVTFTDESAGIGQILPNRYQINGLIDTKNSVLDNIERLCSASGSWLSYDTHEGKWGVVINQTGTSIASFNDSNVIGSITLNGTGLNDLYNSTKVEFPHRDLRDNPDFVSIEIPSGDRNANEFDNTLGLNYDVINEPVQAQLLGFTELKQSRIDLVINFRTDYSYINLKAGDLIAVTNSRFNFTNKLFRIITITEIQEDAGPLMMEISALEYNASIYSTTDLYRYTRTDENGIVTIGSIGIPGTPQVTKFEIDARPGILVESLAPTGVVEAMEFWISNDVQLTEENRTYRILGEVKPINGGIFASSDEVRLEYDNLSASDFVIKTRGKNSATTGPYSAVSGFTNFNPTQTTQAINSDTKAVNALGGIVTALAVIDLLKGVDGLYQKIANTGSLFTSFVDTLKDLTGVDMVKFFSATPLPPEPSKIPAITSINPSTGIVTGGTDVTIFGNNFTSSTSVTFGGTSATTFSIINNTSITATTPPGNTGTTSVLITNPFGTNSANTLFTYTAVPQPVPTIFSITPNSGPVNGGTAVIIKGSNLTSATSVTFDGFQGLGINVVDDNTIAITTPANPAGPADIVVTTPLGTNGASGLYTYLGASSFIERSATYPPDRTTFLDPLTGFTSDKAPVTGSFFVKYTTNNYAPIVKGTGTAMLYKSDGTLVQFLDQDQIIIDNNVIEFPFNTREFGTDYYILLEEGMFEYCNGVNRAILTPNVWNFNTPPYATTPYDIAGDALTVLPTYILNATAISPSISNACPTSTLQLTFNRNVTIGTGTIRLHDAETDSVLATINAASGVPNGNVISYGTLSSIVTLGQNYYLTADAGIATFNTTIDCHASPSASSVAITKSNNLEFGIRSELAYTAFVVSVAPFDEIDMVNIQSNIGISFNRNISFGDSGTISIKRADGSSHQDIDILTSFNNNKTNELIWINTNTVYINPTKDLTPGVTYHIEATVACIKDDCGLTWAGTTDPNLISWRTDPGPIATPSAITTASTGIEIAYDRAIIPGTGTIDVYDQNNNLVKSIPGNDPAIIYT